MNVPNETIPSDRDSVAPLTAVLDCETFLAYARSGRSLPAPGKGQTAERFAALRSVARNNPSVGRLVEAHEDALAILAEAAMAAPAGKALAVWASGSTSRPTLSAQFSPGGAGRRVLHGVQPFCGGATIVDAALICVRENGHDQLLLLNLDRAGIEIDPSGWVSPAFAEAQICSVKFEHVVVEERDVVGPPSFYGNRAGFWHGAVGVAATWAGMVDRLVDDELARRADQVAKNRTEANILDRVRGGSMWAWRWNLDAVLSHAASWIDEHPDDDGGAVALASRHIVYDLGLRCLREVQDQAGPGPMAFNRTFATACEELGLALRQCHGDTDLALLCDLLPHEAPR